MGKSQYQGGMLGSQGTYQPNNEPIGEVARGEWRAYKLSILQ